MERAYLFAKIISIPAILVAFTFKGFVQAKVAIKNGDDTSKSFERDTLNPLKHIDIMGLIFMMIIGIGWMKPLKLDRSKFKDKYKVDLKIRIAGISTNLIIGFIAALVQVVYFKYVPIESSVSTVIYLIIQQVAIINCVWFVLSLLPIAGFDGFGIIIDILRDKAKKFQYALYKYNMIIFIAMALPIFGDKSILDFIVVLPGKYIYRTFIEVLAKIFMIA